jgi:hypothetical protein
VRRLVVLALAVVVVVAAVAVAKTKKKTIPQRVADLEAAVAKLAGRSVTGPPGKDGAPGLPGTPGMNGHDGGDGVGGGGGLLVVDAAGHAVGVLALEDRSTSTTAIRRVGTDLVGFSVDVAGFKDTGVFFEYEALGCQGAKLVSARSALVRSARVGGTAYAYAGDPVQNHSVGSEESENTDPSSCTPDNGCTVLQNGHCCCDVGDDSGDSTSGAFIDRAGPAVTGDTSSFGLVPPFSISGL